MPPLKIWRSKHVLCGPLGKLAIAGESVSGIFFSGGKCLLILASLFGFQRNIFQFCPLRTQQATRGRKCTGNSVTTSSPYLKNLKENQFGNVASTYLKATFTKRELNFRKGGSKNKKKRSDQVSNAACIYCEQCFQDSVFGEVWIQCKRCKWAHEDCSDVQLSEHFYCDFYQ